MSRVKRGVVARERHKKIIASSKGYYGARSRVYRVAKQAVIKAEQYNYRDRRQKKRQARCLWITRLNASVRFYGITYSVFISLLTKSGVILDRKILSLIALYEPASFAVILNNIKNYL